MQAGLAGMGLFFIALLAGEVAGRLAREELAARGSLEIARQQAQLNRLVIEEMVEGVLVIDRRDRVRAANPAARALLAPAGSVRPAPFQLHDLPAWADLRAAVARAFEGGTWPSDTHEITLDFGQGDKRTLQVRGRFTRRRSIEPGTLPPEEFCVLFLEDLRNVQARQKQDKLAAMGRVSAGIAHEIRNPLAAIAQANALLLEDTQDPAQRKLASIVADNVERLKRIVEDVLEVTPGLAPEVHAIDASALVAHTALDFARTAQLKLGPESRLQVQLPTQPLGVYFDAEHLRRVLVNLLENARRHGSDAPGAVRLLLTGFDEHTAVMRVASDGLPIAPEVERHLFEPFFSTRSRGTGLGLYICRELCERYGASIDYRQRPAGERHRNEFVVAMRRAPLAETDPQLQV
jgi:two-component system sensor histidine kinase PilS (NtrC family)